jgi:methylenetetrahydrofolate dehydrogenase (NADP+)/methenyltetrahydrofolate cyclohydrolase
MTMSTVLDGLKLAAALRERLARRVAALARPPGLAIILVGENPASKVYVRNKIRACTEAGVHSELITLPETAGAAELHALIAGLNARSEIDGILVQLPLPQGLPAQALIEAVAPDKDVDGLHSHNLGALFAGRPQVLPCTAAAVMHLLEATGVSLRGRHAVVVGQSNVIGKPAAILLLQAGATVTVCNSKTPDLGAMTRQADILVAAAGRAGLIGADMVRPGAIVIDVGINRNAEGRLCGDVDFAQVAPKCAFITPVPGGVGPMTVAMVVANTVAAAERYLQGRTPG